jgi:hypothetical protein
LFGELPAFRTRDSGALGVARAEPKALISDRHPDVTALETQPLVKSLRINARLMGK